MQHSTLRLFNQLVSPVLVFLPQLVEEWQADFACKKFFTQPHFLLSLFAHFSRAEGANDLATQLGDPTLLTAQMVGHTTGPIDPSTLSRTNQKRSALLGAIVARVTYVFDRGYNSYELFAKIALKQAYFVTRLLDNACFESYQNLSVPTEEAGVGVLKDELITLRLEDESELKLRLVTFQTERGVTYRYLTNRLDLSALNVVRLYLWRWEIELLFAWLKRHLVFSHWYSENENGVCIQLFAGLICYMLLRLYAASQSEIKVRVGLMRYVRQHLTQTVNEAEIKAYLEKLNQTNALEYCYTLMKDPGVNTFETPIFK